jgi:hypothetical protein
VSEETGGILHEHGLKPPVLKFTNMGYLGGAEKFTKEEQVRVKRCSRKFKALHT